MKRTLLPLLLVLFTCSLIAQQFTKITNILPISARGAAGATWVDYDGDGDLDLFVNVFGPTVTNPSGYHYLFQNDCNGKFTKITALPDGVASDNGKMWLDIDNDGDVDLYIPQHAVYYNNGNGTYAKNTTINIIAPNDITRGHAFSDIDNDGDLDLFLANDHRNTGPQNDIIFFRNSGNGAYTQVTTGDAVNDSSRSQTGIFGDYNNDGFMDLFVPMNGTKHFGNVDLLYLNNGAGNFTKVTAGPVATDNNFGYGASWIDYDNDGDLDLFFENTFLGTNRLYQNDGLGNFTDVATPAGFTINRLSQGDNTWGDYDNDGDLDVFLTTFSGNLLYTNNGNGTFTQNTSEIVSNDSIVESYGAAFADYDNDGDLDLFVPNASGAPASFFYINNGNSNHWVDIKLHGTTSNKPAVGARIFVKATIGGIPRWQMREVNANFGSAQGSLRLLNEHFGLLDAIIIDSLKIVWPASHTTQFFTNVSPDRFIEITEGVNAITTAQHCTPDVPATNLGIVKGRAYSDVNNNCVFDSGIDFPIANRVIQATPGPYFALTDNEGNYQLKLNPGLYTISQPVISNDLWTLQSCQINSSYNVNVTAGNNFTGNNFSLFSLLATCQGSVGLVINPDGLNQKKNNCFITSPCPNLNWEYCFNITNNGTTPIPALSQLQVNIPPGFKILSSSINIGTRTNLTALGGNTLTVRINQAIPVGASRNVCVIASVPIGATAPFTATATYTGNGVVTNLISNGDFSAGVSGFTSPGYFLNCAANSATPGFYCVGTNPNIVNGGTSGTDHTTGTGNFLFADGSTGGSTADVWCETMPVSVNTEYVFSGWFNNIDISNALANPNMEVTINGTPLFSTGSIPTIPDIWVNGVNSWCSNLSTSAKVCIHSKISNAGGNDFGIDDLSFFAGYAAANNVITKAACSCDPNDKMVGPDGCGPEGTIGRGIPFTYTIRFENVGTGPAHNIIVRDQLNTNLDPTTLQLLQSTHRITSVEIIPNNTLILSLDSIELPGIPDTLHNNGYVMFSIMPKTTTPDGAQITNQAGIYFDQNKVVLTNTTLNTIRNNPVPDASFKAMTSCSNPLSYNFTYTRVTADNATYSWNFGPNATPSTSAQQNPSNIVFNGMGTDTVSLVVTRFGCTGVASQILSVSDAVCGNNKVQVCHNGHAICISRNALATHLANGDCIGQCHSCIGCKIKDASSDNLNENEAITEIEYSLAPNPFTESSTLRYIIPSNDNVEINLYNCIGGLAKNIFSGYANGNENHEISISSKGLSEGIYFLTIKTSGGVKFTRLVISK